MQRSLSKMEKVVSFAEKVKVIPVKRIEGSLIRNLFYSAEDYRRFRRQTREDRFRSLERRAVKIRTIVKRPLLKRQGSESISIHVHEGVELSQNCSLPSLQNVSVTTTSLGCLRYKLV